MEKARDVAVIVGSLRKNSINRKVANALGHPRTLAPTRYSHFCNNALKIRWLCSNSIITLLGVYNLPVRCYK